MQHSSKLIITNFSTKYVFLIHGSPSYLRRSVVFSPILGLISHQQTFSLFLLIPLCQLAHFLVPLYSLLRLRSPFQVTAWADSHFSKIFHLRLFFPGSLLSVGPTSPSLLLPHCMWDYVWDSSFHFFLCQHLSSVFPCPHVGKGTEHRLPASPILWHFYEKYSFPPQTPALFGEGVLFQYKWESSCTQTRLNHKC